MLKNLTIKVRLIFLIGFLCCLSIIIGVLGLSSLSTTNATVKTLYEDRVVALGQLNNIITLIQQNQITIGTAVAGNPMQLGKAAGEIAARIEKINAEWKRYMATSLTPEEKVLAERFAQDRKKFVAEGLGPAVSAMRANDVTEASEAMRGPVTALFPAVQNDMAALIQLQLDVSKAEFSQSQSRYDKARMMAVAEVLLGLLVGIAMGAWLISGILRALAQATRLVRSVADGDLTQRVEISSHDEIGQLLLAMRVMNEKLGGIVRQVRTGTDTIANAATEIAAGNLDLSSRTEQQAASLEETASSMEELTSTVRQNADNARQANQMVTDASAIAVQGGAAFSRVVETMESIKGSSRQVVDIIAVIDGIAFQTNILALNAAVEAARAGEQGRGFAVVAAEVRNLAQRASAAAKEIKALIDKSVGLVDAGNLLVGQAGKTMTEIVDSVSKVNGVMAEIMAATQEQSAGIEQVNRAVGQMDQVTQQNAALVEEAAAAAASLQDQAGQLAREVGAFKLDPASPGAAFPPAPAPAAAALRLPAKAKSPAPGARATSLARTAPARKQPGRAAPDTDWEAF